MSDQVKRILQVRVGGIDVSNLHVEFNAVRTLRKEPNTASVTIYNLSEANRDALAGNIARVASYDGSISQNLVTQARTIPVEILAGYKSDGISHAQTNIDLLTHVKDSVDRVFAGDLSEATSTYDAPDWVTVVESGDGEVGMRNDRINKSYRTAVNVDQLFKDATEGGLIDPKKAWEKFKELIATKGLVAGVTTFLNGFTLSGNKDKAAQAIAKAAGLELSVQNGEYQALEPGRPIGDFAVDLSRETGGVHPGLYDRFDFHCKFNLPLERNAYLATFCIRVF